MWAGSGRASRGPNQSLLCGGGVGVRRPGLGGHGGGCGGGIGVAGSGAAGGVMAVQGRPSLSGPGGI